MTLRTRYRAVVQFCLLVTTFFTFGTLAQAQDSIRSDRRLPNDVYLYATTPDVPKSFDEFQQTPIGQLLYGPELDKFREHILSWMNDNLEQGTSRFEEELGFPLSDLASLLDGEASIAVTRPAGGALAAVVFLGTGDHQDILDAITSKIDEAVADQEKVTKSTETVSGVEISVYTVQTDNPSMPTATACYFVKDGELVIGSSVGALSAILQRWDGNQDQTFAKNSTYARFLEKCATSDGSEPDMILYVAPVELTLGVLQTIPETQFVGAMAAGFLPQFGLNTLRGAGSTIQMNTDEFGSISRSLVMIDQPPRGIFKGFEFRPTFSEIPAWVPTAVGQYFAFDWNLVALYETVENLYDTWVGRQPGSFDQLVTQTTLRADGQNVHLKRDIIDVLNGRFEGYYIAPQGDDPTDFDGVLAIGVTDADKADKLIKMAIERADAVREGDVGGVAARFVTMGDFDFAIAVQDNIIYVARGLTPLKHALTGEADADSLVQSEAYLQAKKHLPEMYSFFSYQSPATTLRSSYEQVRNGQLDSAFEGAIDFSLLPPFAEIEKYFTPSFSYSVPTDDGPYSVQFMLPLKD